MNSSLQKNNKKTILFSFVLACLNPAVSSAQVTAPVVDATTEASTETVTGTSTETTSETTTEAENAASNAATSTLGSSSGGFTSEPESTSSGGGGGAGIGVLAVGAVVLMVTNMSAKGKKPAIQKTLLETGFNNKIKFTEYKLINSSQNKENGSTFSLQVGSFDSNFDRGNSSLSSVNLRWTHQISENMKFYSDLGSSWKTSFGVGKVAVSDWFSLNFRKNNVLSSKDSLRFTGAIANAPLSNSKNDVFSDQLNLNNSSEYGSLFSRASTRIELAYIRRLMDNQRLGFRLATEELNKNIRDSHATLLWQKQL